MAPLLLSYITLCQNESKYAMVFVRYQTSNLSVKVMLTSVVCIRTATNFSSVSLTPVIRCLMWYPMTSGEVANMSPQFCYHIALDKDRVDKVDSQVIQTSWWPCKLPGWPWDWSQVKTMTSLSKQTGPFHQGANHLACNKWGLAGQELCSSEVEVTKPIFSIAVLIIFQIFQYLSHWLDTEYHIHIWQVSLQLSCSDTCQIWKRFEHIIL